MSESDGLESLRKEAGRLFEAGNYRLANAAYSRLIAEALAAGAILIELDARDGACISQGNLGEFEEAIDTAMRLLARARETENDRYKIFAGLRLGSTLANFSVRDRWSEVEAVLLDGLDRAQEMRDSFLEAYHLARLGTYAESVGEYDKAMLWLQQGLDSASRLTDERDAIWLRGDIYSSLANLMRAKGDMREARRYAEISLAEFERHGHVTCIACAQGILARIEYEEGAYEQACELLDTALEHVHGGGEQEIELVRSLALRARGDLVASLAAAQRSLELARKMRMKVEEVRALVSLGQTLRMLGSGEAAIEALSLAWRIAEERGYQDCLDELKLLDGAP